MKKNLLFKISIISGLIIIFLILTSCPWPGDNGGQGAEGESVWSVSGNNIYYSNGKVEIGTENPGTALEVNGLLKVGAFTFPNTDGSHGYVLKTDGAGKVSRKTFRISMIWSWRHTLIVSI